MVQDRDNLRNNANMIIDYRVRLSLIHTHGAVPLPCSDSAVSFV